MINPTTLQAQLDTLNRAHRNTVAANLATGRPAGENTGGLLWVAGGLRDKLDEALAGIEPCQLEAEYHYFEDDEEGTDVTLD